MTFGKTIRHLKTVVWWPMAAISYFMQEKQLKVKLKIKTKTKAAKKFDLKKTKLQSLKKNKSGKNKNKKKKKNKRGKKNLNRNDFKRAQISQNCFFFSFLFFLSNSNFISVSFINLSFYCFFKRNIHAWPTAANIN